VTQPAAP